MLYSLRPIKFKRISTLNLIGLCLLRCAWNSCCCFYTCKFLALLLHNWEAWTLYLGCCTRVVSMLYPCHTSVLLAVLCYNFLENCSCYHVVPVSVSVLPSFTINA